MNIETEKKILNRENKIINRSGAESWLAEKRQKSEDRKDQSEQAEVWSTSCFP